MSQAAQQLHEYLDAKYPGIRISRKSCRDTAGGSVSQHSAYRYGEYDSNALDIMGADAAFGYSYTETQEWLDAVYADIDAHRQEWSIRIMLWRVPDHHGHIHIDTYPTCHDHKWCGRDIEPLFMYSDGSYEYTQDPAPENGEYHGPEDDDMTYDQLRAAEFDYWTDVNIMEAWDAGMFEDTNRVGFHTYWVVERATRTAGQKARFMTDYYAHLWKRS